MRDKINAMCARGRDLKAGFSVEEVSQGPTVHTCTLRPDRGVRVRSILLIEDDLTIAAGVRSVRVAVEDGRLILEFPREPREFFTLDDVRDHLRVGELFIGVDMHYRAVGVPLSTLPHLAVAGSTGSGKSVALHAMIQGLAAKNNPADLRMILVDPKGVEFTQYTALPHVAEVAVSVESVERCLDNLVREMDARYAAHIAHPKWVMFIDEWADLFLRRKQLKDPLTLLLAKSRAAGIHIVLATQRPSVKVLPGDLKANLPKRLALRVSSGTDSKVVLDATGAERLLGKGDALFSSEEGVTRVQVPSVSPSLLGKLLAHYSAP